MRGVGSSAGVNCWEWDVGNCTDGQPLPEGFLLLLRLSSSGEIKFPLALVAMDPLENGFGGCH